MSEHWLPVASHPDAREFLCVDGKLVAWVTRKGDKFRAGICGNFEVKKECESLEKAKAWCVVMLRVGTLTQKNPQPKPGVDVDVARGLRAGQNPHAHINRIGLRRHMV